MRGATAIARALFTAVTALSGWRRRGLALALGAVAAAAMPPLPAVFLLIPAMTGLLWLVFARPSPRPAFAVGWWFGLGHYSVGLYWLANAFLVKAERLGWMAPFAVLAMAAVLALFPACVAFLVARLGRRSPWQGRVLVFAALWTAFEWLRSWIFTGFPWNPVGSAWAFSDAMIQSTAVAGVYGLGLLTVAAAAMPAALAGGRGGLRPVLAVYLILGVVWAGGAWRLSGADAGTVEGVRLRLVQPNTDQRLKWRREWRQHNFREQIAMSAAPAVSDTPPTHVLWAETAATFFLANDAPRRAAIARGVPPGGLIITGAPRTTPTRETPYRVWNSLHAIDGKGDVVATYDKFHLVPFGEYLPAPLRGIPGLSKMTAGGTDFSAGPGPRTLTLKGLPPVSPLICYEVIFPARVVDPAHRPEWILNLTNDAWYGLSAGPHQHFAAARLRAVEEGLPLVRVANTGISGIIDGYGRVTVELGLAEQGVLDGDLPRALAATPYARWGNGVVLLLVLAAAAGLWWPRSRATVELE